VGVRAEVIIAARDGNTQRRQHCVKVTPRD
jgi:hypothetical protein